MPKANAAGGTYYGYEGLVEDANNRVSELDPSRNADGTVVDGFESEERDLSDREAGDYNVGEPPLTTDRDAQEEQDAQREREEEQEENAGSEKDQRTDTEREADENAAASRHAAKVHLTPDAVKKEEAAKPSATKASAPSASAKKR